VKGFLYLRNFGINLSGLSEREGKTLLLRLTRRENDEHDMKNASAVVDVLGGHPLAIAHMSRVILTRDLNFEEFLDIYSEHTGKKTLYDGWKIHILSRRHYNKSLRLALAIDSLSLGRALLDVISLLDPDSIQESILQYNPAVSKWDAYPKTTLEYMDSQMELYATSLISKSKETKTLSIHRLIQDFWRTEMSDVTFNEVYRRTLDMLAARWPITFSGFGDVSTNWHKCDKLLRHVIAIWKHSDRFDATTLLSEVSLKRCNFILDTVWCVNG
jgi:hypothetical protein